MVKTCIEDDSEEPNSFTFETRLDGSVICAVPITINCIFNEEPNCAETISSPLFFIHLAPAKNKRPFTPRDSTEETLLGLEPIVWDEK